MERSVVCPYCGVGCRLVMRDGRVHGVGGVSGGLLCARGVGYGLQYLKSPRRLKRPLVRVGGALREASWSEALERAAALLRDAAASRGGWDAVGFIGGSKLFNEEGFALQKLARLLGSPNIDTCSRLCHYPSLLAQLEALGFGGLTAPYQELLETQAVLIAGWNGAVTAPVLFARYVLGAVRRGARLAVVDVWRSETARTAHLYVRVHPRGDSLLYAALARILADRGVAPEARENIENLDELLSVIGEVNPEAYARAAGVEPVELEALAKLLDVERGSVLWGMGLTQHIKPKPAIQWLLVVAALRGWLWRRGCVVGGVRGQSNVQGVNDMGVLPEFLPGYRPASDPQARRLFAEAWGVEPPPGPGLSETLMLEEAGRSIRAMLIAAENTAASHPGGADALEKLDALIVIDTVYNETAALADVILPAAGWGEKEGSATNAEGRVQWSSAIAEPPGEAKPDLAVISALAEKLGLSDRVRYTTPWDAHPEIEALVPRYKGFSANLRKSGEHLLPRKTGRVRLTPEKPVKPATPDARKGKLVLVTLRGETYCTGATYEKPPAPIRAWKGAGPGTARIETREGTIVARITEDPNVPEGILLAEWGHGINKVLPRSIDCETGIMELKAVWARLER